MVVVNLIQYFVSEEFKDLYLLLMWSGVVVGMMVLIEVDIGLFLVDIKIKVLFIDQDYYLIKGSKMYILGGDQDIIDNIVYLVLVKIKDVFVGVKGILLFFVFKWLVDGNGQFILCNDVKFVGLLYKMGYCGIMFIVLNFGENDDCIGYLIGELYQGLKYMFMMMNEVCIGVGFGVVVFGYWGYVEFLNYVKECFQGCYLSNKDLEFKFFVIIEYVDVKCMLLV